MHLSELYARDLGCKIGYPYLVPHFFPIPYENQFVTIHNSDKVPAKSYSYWSTVVKILKPELQKRNINLYQVGAHGDLEIEGVDHFFDYLSLKQSSFLLSKSLCHVGIDSVPGHIASVFNKPTVTLIAHTYSETCKPLWNGEKAIILESHRNGNKPSFSLNEDPKTVDLIKPEEIAQAVFKQLGIKQASSEETLYIGPKFLYKTVDIVPSKNQAEIKVDNKKDIRMRMDVCFDEQAMFDCLVQHSFPQTIITNRPIDEEKINYLKPRIKKIVYSAAEFDKKFLFFLRHSGIPFELTCFDKKNLPKQRKIYFDFDIHYENQIEKAEAIKNEIHGKIHANVNIDPGKVYVIEGQQLISLGKNIEDPVFWVDFDYFRVYTPVEWKNNL